MRTHLVIPDTQFGPGRSHGWLKGLGRLIAERRPDVIVQLGDWYDMASLSSYDRGRRAAENRRVFKDIEAGNEACWLLDDLIDIKSYKPRAVFLVGNHEQRIERYIEDHPELEGTLSYSNLAMTDWETHGFLRPVTIDGITYSHYFVRGNSGKVTQSKNGAPNARAMVQREQRSCTAGHLQGFDYYEHYTSHGRHQGLVAGSCYTHQESYLTPQGCKYWRGVIWKNIRKSGEYDFERIGIERLKEMSK